MKVVDKIKSKAGDVTKKVRKFCYAVDDFCYENSEAIAFVVGFGLTTAAMVEGVIIGQNIGYTKGKKDAYEQILKNNVTGFITKNLDGITK